MLEFIFISVSVGVWLCVCVYVYLCMSLLLNLLLFEIYICSFLVLFCFVYTESAGGMGALVRLPGADRSCNLLTDWTAKFVFMRQLRDRRTN